MTCTQEALKSGMPDFSSITMSRIPDDGVIKLTCNRGHKTAIIIQQEKFEILSAMAIKAIVDGYYRDAIASFAGSLERLYEFFVRVTCRKNGINTSTFAPAWKEMSNQSERQLGAFIGIYLVETGQSPQLLHQEQIKFRNAVIHKGKFPERDKTIKFGQSVLDCAVPILQRLKSESYSSALQEITMESIFNRSNAERKKGVNISTMAMPTFLCLCTAEQPNSVETAVANYMAQPDYEEFVKKMQAFGATIPPVSARPIGPLPV